MVLHNAQHTNTLCFKEYSVIYEGTETAGKAVIFLNQRGQQIAICQNVHHTLHFLLL